MALEVAPHNKALHQTGALHFVVAPAGEGRCSADQQLSEERRIQRLSNRSF